MGSDMSVVAFLDLDDSIFQTLPKCPPGARLEVAAVNRDGSPGSFMTPKQRRLVDWLLATTHVIPTTGRNLEAYRRVRIAFPGCAILNHGGTIVDAQGAPDLEWYEQLESDLCPDELRRLQLEVLAQSFGVRARLIGDHGRTLYLSVKHPSVDLAELAACRRFLAARIDRDRVRLIESANNLAVLPVGVSKERAVRHVISSRAAPDELVLGLGDAPSDLGFLKLCDIAGAPTRSAIFLAVPEGEP